MSRAIKFTNSDHQIPSVGLGTWQFPSDEVLKAAIECALKTGYRHFDTAFDYENERIIGEVLKDWIDSGKIKREEIFVTTKLPFIGNQPEKVAKFLMLSLEELKLDYVDLYTIHFPAGLHCEDDDELFPEDDDGNTVLDLNTNLIALWQAMEAQVDAGRCKSIGLSNFNSEQIERIVSSARIKPSNLQVELHAYFQQRPLRDLCSKFGITVCAYGTLGSKGRLDFSAEHGTLTPTIPDVLDDQTVLKIAKSHDKTPAQILLRHLVQQDIAVIPKSVFEQRIQENFDIFDFSLTCQEMDALKNLDQNLRTFKFDFFAGIENHPEYPFHIPY